LAISAANSRVSSLPNLISGHVGLGQQPPKVRDIFTADEVVH